MQESILKSLAIGLICSAVLAQSVSAQRPAAAELPDGAGKQLVQAVCTACHQPSTIIRSAGYDTPERWREVFSTMIALPDADAKVIADYLAEHFREKEERRPVLVDGPVQIDFEEWIVPTLGQRSRDPVEAPDGSIWWTGMWASLIGHLDPKTGKMEEFALPPEARPQSIVPDKDGNIWYTGNSNATIGMLDPGTGEITEYPTRARDPHTATFHPNGMLYFTAQQAAVLGRLDPQTGELTEIDTEPRPYGIQVASDGTIWVAYNGTNKIGALDPETMVVRYYTIAEPETRIRRLGLSSDGMVWYVNSTMGRIGRLDPSTGSFKEWDSPSGPKSHPYAIAVINDKIWYNESGMRPDVLVRFDPETQSFQSWEIPSGVGIVRNMWVTRQGELLIHQTSSNRVGRVTIKDLAN
jgi:virginiamycin B lyase